MGSRLVLAAVVALLATGLWLGDAALQSRELGTVADRSRLLAAGILSQQLRMASADDPEKALIEANAAIQKRCDAIAHVSVLPWHSNIARAKDAIAAYCKADEAVRADAVSFWRTGQMDVDKAEDEASTQARAAHLLEKAVPTPAMFDVRKRIDRIGPPIIIDQRRSTSLPLSAGSSSELPLQVGQNHGPSRQLHNSGSG